MRVESLFLEVGNLIGQSSNNSLFHQITLYYSEFIHLLRIKILKPCITLLGWKDLCRVHAELLEVDADEGEERSEGREEEEVEQLRNEKAVRRRVREKPGENIGNGAGFWFRVFILK